MIKHRTQLLSHGLKTTRRKALDIIEYALERTDPYHATKREVRIDNGHLSVGGQTFDLARFNKIYAIGAGKATYRQAQALEEILGDHLTDGFIIVKDGQAGPLDRIRITEAAHPVPDERSFEACLETMRMADQAGAGDLVFCLMSGGVSALCPCPVPGISRENKMEMNRLLVHCGADVTEIMTVRRHLSQLKGGRLARRLRPATVIALTVSDAIGDPMDWNTDWTSADTTTFEDAVGVLAKYDLWDKTPPAVQAYFREFQPEKETPKDLSDQPILNWMTVRTADLWQAAVERAGQLGYQAHLLTTVMCGESREVGRTLTAMARQVAESGQPFQPPCALIAIGETAVRVQDLTRGKGGANQELAVGGCLDLSPADPIVMCALDTDGTDGPTHLAGGLTDGPTAVRAAQAGFDLYRTLMAHDVTPLLEATGDAIEIGSTGTNVNDIVVYLIDGRTGE